MTDPDPARTTAIHLQRRCTDFLTRAQQGHQPGCTKIDAHIRDLRDAINHHAPHLDLPLLEGAAAYLMLRSQGAPDLETLVP